MPYTPYDPFPQIIPLAIGRLKCLTIEGTRKSLQDIAAHLTRPAPLLEELSVYGGPRCEPNHYPIFTPVLLNGDLSSLRDFALQTVHTKLPWRNMINLTQFMLTDVSPLSMRQLLDFLESAPRLRDIYLHSVPVTPGTQNGRLVLLRCLNRMDIAACPASALLDHLLIPVGARLVAEVNLPGFLIKDYLPRSLYNLRNFFAFTTIRLSSRRPCPHIQFSGPNGQVEMRSGVSQVDMTRTLFESLTQFDTSKTERLEIDRGNPQSNDPPYRALLPMQTLLTFTLSLCARPHIFIHALHPSMSSSGDVVCPKLEEIVIRHRKTFDIESVLGTVAARAASGAKLKLVRIVSRDESVEIDVSELKKHVPRVECSREVDGAGDGGYWSDKEG